MLSLKEVTMANKNLFSSQTSTLPRTNTVNEAGGRAYKFGPYHALAQLAATGCFNGVYYQSAETQLDEVRKLMDQVDDVYLAKLAVYARQQASMKDMPAALLVELSARDTELMHRVFDRVVDNGRVLRTVFQMIRSGQFGRTSLSSSLQRAFQRWLNEASVGKLLSASIGHDPSLRDVLRLARPTPKDNRQRALFGWLTGKDVDKWAPATEADLSAEVLRLNEFRRSRRAEQQVKILQELSVRWDLLADAALGPQVWKAIARRMGPQALRMNLNTLLRQKVFAGGFGLDNRAMIDYVAGRLADEDEIRRSRQFPYQYLSAYLNASKDVPQQIRGALHQAAEIACGNVPELPGPVAIGLDVSGSMWSPVTGYRGGGTTKMRCVDVAALFAAAILRRNPDSVIIPFDTRAYDARIDPQDSILSLAERLAQYGGGGTDCSLPLHAANTKYRQRRFAGCVLVSDCESWIDVNRSRQYWRTSATAVMQEWQSFVNNQLALGGHDIPSPKLICIDLQPYGSTQAPDRDDILNVGGFSDAVFKLVSSFLNDDSNRFVEEVEAIVL
jgi:60 kDa SS-A/Ro ribonucleoprotein